MLVAIISLAVGIVAGQLIRIELNQSAIAALQSFFNSPEVQSVATSAIDTVRSVAKLVQPKAKPVQPAVAVLPAAEKVTPSQKPIAAENPVLSSRGEVKAAASVACTQGVKNGVSVS